MYSWIEKGYSKRADRSDGQIFYRRSYKNNEFEIVHDIQENKESKISLVVSSTGDIRFTTFKNLQSLNKKQILNFVEQLEQLSQENITVDLWVKEIGPLQQIEQEALQ